jgi:hypothetical protein
MIIMQIINYYFLFEFVKFLNKDKFLILGVITHANIKNKTNNLFLLILYIL